MPHLLTLGLNLHQVPSNAATSRQGGETCTSDNQQDILDGLQNRAFAKEAAACGAETCSANQEQTIPIGINIDSPDEDSRMILDVVSDDCFPTAEQHAVYHTLTSMDPNSAEMANFFSRSHLFPQQLFTDIDDLLKIPRWYWLEGFLNTDLQPRIRCHVCSLFWTEFMIKTHHVYRQRSNIAKNTGMKQSQPAWNRDKVLKHEKNREHAEIVLWLKDTAATDMQYATNAATQR